MRPTKGNIMNRWKILCGILAGIIVIDEFVIAQINKKRFNHNLEIIHDYRRKLKRSEDLGAYYEKVLIQHKVPYTEFDSLVQDYYLK
jgi:hypothetical protein